LRKCRSDFGKDGIRVTVDVYGPDANRVVCLKGGDHSHNDSMSIAGPLKGEEWIGKSVKNDIINCKNIRYFRGITERRREQT